jgi:CheY-like chemotaxis protein
LATIHHDKNFNYEPQQYKEPGNGTGFRKQPVVRIALPMRGYPSENPCLEMVTTMNSDKPIEILLVDDSPSDTDLTVEALQEGKIRNHLSTVEDGVRAMQFLRREGEYAQAPRPDLILLDLNLPRKDGREVLAEIKADPVLKTIPVVIMTTSQAEKDVDQAYQLNANCYVTKPLDFLQFVALVRSIENFWLTIVTLPRND